MAARRDFGNMALATEDTRAAWGWTGVEQFVQDLRHGGRLLLRRPAFTIAATLTLALGTGATATVFSLLDAVLPRWRCWLGTICRAPFRSPRSTCNSMLACCCSASCFSRSLD